MRTKEKSRNGYSVEERLIKKDMKQGLYKKLKQRNRYIDRRKENNHFINRYQ